MKHYLLRLLRELDGVYEHKLAVKCGKEYGSFPELDQLILDGFAKRLSKQRGFVVKGIYLTDAGRVELDRLDAIPPAPRVLSPEQLRRQELVQKLKDNTITDVEVRELLRMVIRF